MMKRIVPVAVLLALGATAADEATPLPACCRQAK